MTKQTKYRYPYEINLDLNHDSTPAEMEEFIYEHFTGDFSYENNYNWSTRTSIRRYWFEKRDEAIIFKLTFTGGF